MNLNTNPHKKKENGSECCNPDVINTSETCLKCHSPSNIQQEAIERELAKHTLGNLTSAKRVTRLQTNQKECGICQNIIKQQGSLPNCKHTFCLTCILKWSKTENTCPMCKLRFT
jgi:hypothetical protein